MINRSYLTYAVLPKRLDGEPVALLRQGVAAGCFSPTVDGVDQGWDRYASRGNQNLFSKCHFESLTAWTPSPLPIYNTVRRVGRR